MPTFEPGLVVRVPFPYSHGATHERRPALVVSTVGTGAVFLLWVLMITSAENRRWPGDVPLGDLPRAGLPVPSMVRTARIATIEAAVAEVIGNVDHGTMADVRALLKSRLLGNPS